jgi:hypothetical protein
MNFLKFQMVWCPTHRVRGPVVWCCAPPSSGRYTHVFYCFLPPKPNQMGQYCCWSCKVPRAHKGGFATNDLEFYIKQSEWVLKISGNNLQSIEGRTCFNFLGQVAMSKPNKIWFVNAPIKTTERVREIVLIHWHWPYWTWEVISPEVVLNNYLKRYSKPKQCLIFKSL